MAAPNKRILTLKVKRHESDTLGIRYDIVELSGLDIANSVKGWSWDKQLGEPPVLTLELYGIIETIGGCDGSHD